MTTILILLTIFNTIVTIILLKLLLKDNYDRYKDDNLLFAKIRVWMMSVIMFFINLNILIGIIFNFIDNYDMKLFSALYLMFTSFQLYIYFGLKKKRRENK